MVGGSMWVVGGSWSTWRELMQTQGEHANSSQKRLDRNPGSYYCEATVLSTTLLCRNILFKHWWSETNYIYQSIQVACTHCWILHSCVTLLFNNSEDKYKQIHNQKFLPQWSPNPEIPSLFQTDQSLIHCAPQDSEFMSFTMNVELEGREDEELASNSIVKTWKSMESFEQIR